MPPTSRQEYARQIGRRTGKELSGPKVDDMTHARLASEFFAQRRRERSGHPARRDEQPDLAGRPGPTERLLQKRGVQVPFAMRSSGPSTLQSSPKRRIFPFERHGADVGRI